jgi:CPA1 family monovalent cation:H+ antiporter
MFDELAEPVLRELCGLLRPRFAHPEERLFTAGDRGDEMYFIASGAVEVRQEDWVVRLGRGDFFGELAVLLARRRSATVTAIAYCHLLVLQGKDFRRFLKAHPDLRARIREVAEARRIAAVRYPGRLVSAAAMSAGSGEDEPGDAEARDPGTS